MQIQVKNNIAVVRSGGIVITDAQSVLDLMMAVHYDHGCTGVVLENPPPQTSHPMIEP